MKQICMIISVLVLLNGCTSSDVKTVQSTLGQASSVEKLLEVIDEPGTVVLEKHLTANWQVPLSGLLNLEHEKAIEAGLKDKAEPIQIFAYTLRHPKEGLYLVDSGVSTHFLEGEDNEVSYLVNKAMGISDLEVVKTTKQLVSEQEALSGVFITHIHLDHIMGLNDMKNVPVYIGPGDVGLKTVTNAVSRGTTNRLLSTVDQLNEWQFDEGGIIDVFGDGSVWALHSPGHTPGTTAYLARTTDGPQLMIGDVTHTRWGWDNGVEPGTYSENGPQNAESLQKLKRLEEIVTTLTVHPGHQQ